MALNYIIGTVEYNGKEIQVIIKKTNSDISNYKFTHKGFAFNKQQVDMYLTGNASIKGFVVDIDKRQIKADTSRTITENLVGQWFVPRSMLDKAIIYRNYDDKTKIEDDSQYMFTDFFRYAVKLDLEELPARKYDVTIRNFDCKQCGFTCKTYAWIPWARYPNGEMVPEPYGRDFVYCVDCREHMEDPHMAVLSII